MNPVNENLPFVFLQPGQMYLAREPTIIETILGSCIGVTMFSRHAGIGAICHGLLPSCVDNNVCDFVSCFRYVSCSIWQMLERFAQSRINQTELEVKLFGGSEMLERATGPKQPKSVGKQNMEIALEIIKSKGLNLLSSDLGGPHGRKIYFNTQTGEVLLKRLSKTNFSQIGSTSAPRGANLTLELKGT